MSRCFPYPPPGYSLKRESYEALIGSIKLQKERERAKAERKKERKREKKEKKREKEANAKQNVSGSIHGEKGKLKDMQTPKSEKERVGLKGEFIKKSGEDEAEKLERSGLTEEYEQQVCSGSPYYLSNSTQNTNKRRKMESPVGGIPSQGNTNIISIRLPLQKHTESDAMSKERISSSSGRTDSIGQHNSDIGHGCCSQEKFCSTSTSGGMETSSAATSFVNRFRLVESLYKDIVGSWTAPTLRNERADVDEEEWLFHRKNEERDRSKASSNVMCCGSSVLPEVDIYALPFMVPF